MPSIPGSIRSRSTASENPALEGREAPGAVGRDGDGAAVLLEEAGEKLVKANVVVDEEQSDGHNAPTSLARIGVWLRFLRCPVARGTRGIPHCGTATGDSRAAHLGPSGGVCSVDLLDRLPLTSSAPPLISFSTSPVAAPAAARFTRPATSCAVPAASCFAASAFFRASSLASSAWRWTSAVAWSIFPSASKRSASPAVLPRASLTLPPASFAASLASHRCPWGPP